MPHIMLATVFCEHFGLQPAYAHALQLGGATGFAMVMLAHELVAAGRLRNVLVVAGENRMSAPGGRDKAVQTLAQVGHPVHEVPLGPTIPAYYGLVASRYMHEHKISARDLAEFAVLMRANARRIRARSSRNRSPSTTCWPRNPSRRRCDCSTAARSRTAARPSSSAGSARDAAGVRIIGAGQAHTHQHISAAPSLTEFGARLSMDRAIEATGRKLATTDVDYVAIYDSFTITLAILLEEIGLAPRGRRDAWLAKGISPAAGQTAQYPRRVALLRPLRCRRRHGAPGRGAAADDRPRRPAPGCRYGARVAPRRRRRAVVARSLVLERTP